MPVTSAALLPYLLNDRGVSVWLAHMGGPFWARKDEAAWTVVKGEYTEGEEPRAAALREWAEEMGSPAPDPGEELGSFVQSSRKTVTVFAARVADPSDVAFVTSNTVDLEWPPRSGRMQAFPEIDRATWFPLAEARVKILRVQLQILDALESRVGG